MKCKSVLSLILIGLMTFASSTSKALPPTGQIEAGAIAVNGNKNSESYSSKIKLVWKRELNLYNINGRYIKSLSDGLESSRNWEVGARYERDFSEKVGFYLGQKVESDIFSGYTQRDSTDLGLKYLIINEQNLNWKAEFGDRHQKVQSTTDQVTTENLGRLYTEINKIWNQGLSVKYWIEYLPNFTQKDSYLMNTEASVGLMMTSVLSLNLGYFLQYQNTPLITGKYTTTTTTLNLVAKF